MGAVKMSEKKSDNAKKKPFSKVLKIIFYIFLILLLIAGAIFASVKISDSRNLGDTSKFERITRQIAEQNNRLAALEQLSSSVSANTQQLASTAHALSLLSEKFHQLYEEVGNNKIEHMQNNLQAFDHRISDMEEQKSLEALILSVALLIKENASYHRPFVEEADILAEINQQKEANLAEINTINKYKTSEIADNMQLAQRFSEIMEDFTFSQQAEEEPKETRFSKSIKMIKDTVSGMHFDKVVVLKKEKKTAHQQELLDTLFKLVNAYDYAGAINFIAQNAEFTAIDNKEFTAWQTSVTDRLNFDAALSKLIANQLKTLREDIKNTDTKTIVKEEQPKPEEAPKEEVISAEETAVND